LVERQKFRLEQDSARALSRHHQQRAHLRIERAHDQGFPSARLNFDDPDAKYGSPESRTMVPQSQAEPPPIQRMEHHHHCSGPGKYPLLGLFVPFLLCIIMHLSLLLVLLKTIHLLFYNKTKRIIKFWKFCENSCEKKKQTEDFEKKRSKEGTVQSFSHQSNTLWPPSCSLLSSIITHPGT
jgi:hypothetical protein